MGDEVDFDELWDGHIHDRMFLRDYDGTHGNQFIAYYQTLEPGLKGGFRRGLESVIARQRRGWEAAQSYLEWIRKLDGDRDPG